MATCDCERVGDAWVVRLRGQFFTDEDSELFLNSITRAPEGVRCVVINWTAVEAMSSLSFGALYRGSQEITKRGVSYRNCAYSSRIKAIIPHIKWLYDWRYAETEREALEACAQDARDALPGPPPPR